MNRFLQWLNLVGVLVLAVLCVVQWRVNRRLNLELNAAETTRQQQAARMDDQEKRLRGGASDLDGFREQLARAATARAEAEARLTLVERAARQLTNERDQLKTSVTNWAAAVTARDEQLKKAAAELGQFAAERNAAVAKFNELAAKQNASVKEFERRLQEHNAQVLELNTRTREFNAQVEKFNALNQSAPAPPKPAP